MNGQMLKELKEIEKDAEMPARVSNRLILAGMIQLYDIVATGDYDSRIKSNSRLIKVLLGLQTIIIGALIYSS